MAVKQIIQVENVVPEEMFKILFENTLFYRRPTKTRII